METLKTNYTSRIRFRKVIVLFEAIGFTFYLVGFTTPYWVSFLSTKSMLTSTRGLFATCVTTAGKPKCANIEHYTDLLIASIVFACLSLITYIVALISGLLVINWLQEQRSRLVKLSIVTNILTGVLIIAVVTVYSLSFREIEGTPYFAFYLVVVSGCFIIVTGVVWIIDYKLPEPKKSHPFNITPLITLTQTNKSTLVKVKHTKVQQAW